MCCSEYVLPLVHATSTFAPPGIVLPDDSVIASKTAPDPIATSVPSGETVKCPRINELPWYGESSSLPSVPSSFTGMRCRSLGE